MPAADSELVRRLRAAGLVFMGKTNTPELAIGPTTEPRLFGPTRNPWDAARTAGGSSGGAAAAVSARVAPMAHGNDAGGSIRIPASCCGLVGLKPSRGRVSLAPHYGDMWAGLVSELGVTRTVRDTAALLDAVAGPGIGEPYCPRRRRSGPTPPRWTDRRGSLKIGFSLESPLGDAIDPECERAVRDAAALCESLGHAVEEARPDFDAEELWTKFTTLLSAGSAWAIADLGAAHRPHRRPPALRAVRVDVRRTRAGARRARLPARGPGHAARRFATCPHSSAGSTCG